MEQFYEKSITVKEIKVVKGIIKADDNNIITEYDLFYWANFIPHFSNDNNIRIIGECGFDTECEKSSFTFNYNIEEDSVSVFEPYRIAICKEEIYDKYAKNIYYNEYAKHNYSKEKEEKCLPWIRFPRTKDGVFITELIENIFNRIPNKIIFH
jgi:hypothetical protein